jgi:hypothetical protein
VFEAGQGGDECFERFSFTAEFLRTLRVVPDGRILG